MLNSDSSVILDASAFYAGIPFSGLLKYCTTGKVFEEIRHIKSSISAIEVLVQTGNLKVIEPEAKFINSARYAAKKSGDLIKMSEADLSVIALAFELRGSNPLLITDDYAVANVGKLSNIQVSYVMSKGITKGKAVEIQQLSILTSLPGIGVKLAVRLLMKFKTPIKALNASTTDLARIGGMGYARASKLRKILDTILVDEKMELQTALDTYDINDNKIPFTNR